MERYHLHMPGWMHLHKPDWYRLGNRFEHMIHDPRFWAVLALVILLTLMVLTAIYSKPVNSSSTLTHPYLPP